MEIAPIPQVARVGRLNVEGMAQLLKLKIQVEPLSELTRRERNSLRFCYPLTVCLAG